jgi:protein-disulfide isomerase
MPTGVDADGNFYRGDPDARVKLVEWSDFECPYCARHATEVGPLLDEAYVATGKVQHVFRNLPLSFHPNAVPSAVAAYCAGQQDPALFWKMHDWLFANQSVWSSGQDAPAQFREQALALRADADKYDACVTAPETEAAINRDLSEGMQLQIAGTPAFYVNDWFLGGAYPFEAFQDAIIKAEQGIHPPPTPTPLPEGVAPYDADPSRPGMTYDGSPTRGEGDARLILVAFDDFKCEACLQHFKEIEPLLKSKYVDTGELREVFKFYPISAPHAAVASLCALEQGKFWEFHDLLFQEQANWTDGDRARMLEYGDQLKLDVAKLEECIADGRHQDQIENEGGLAQELGFFAAPSFVLIDTQANTGLPIQGATTPEQFEEAIQQLLNPPTPEPEPTPAPTPTP